MTNTVDPDQTASEEAVWSGSTSFVILSEVKALFALEFKLLVGFVLSAGLT